MAAEIAQASNDVTQLEPMIAATRATLEQAGIADEVGRLVADAGYRRAANVDGSIANAPVLFIAVAQQPVFGQTKYVGNVEAFSRRGLQAVQDEWKLIAATHNLRKLHRAQLA